MLVGLRDETLREMIIGIVLYGLIGQVIMLLFVDDILSYTIGWWIGVVLAVICAYHMWWALDRALDLIAKDVTKTMITHNMLRYGVIIVVMGVVMVTEVGNPLVAVFGVFGLKACAYAQPLIHRGVTKIQDLLKRKKER